MRKMVLLAGSTAVLMMGVAEAGQFSGPYFGAKIGANTSGASGTKNVPGHRAISIIVQGGYLQGGYNFDLGAVEIGIGAYADWNSYAKHSDGTAYGTRSFGMDTKAGIPFGYWLAYAKIGRGNNFATDDLSFVSQVSLNHALGFEYKMAPHWSSVVEYKINKFSSNDGSTTIRNKTVSFGLNYYFDEPPKPAPPPVTKPEPEIELIPIEQAPPIPIAPPVSEAWKTFMEDKPVRIEDSDFVADTARLKLDSDKRILNEVVEFVIGRPDSRLEVTGYTDSIGSEKQNRELSLARANSVKKYLVSKGVPADRITTKGGGSKNPVGDNKTRGGRTLNRRVEIRTVANEVKAAPKQEEKSPEQEKTPVQQKEGPVAI